MIEKGLKDVYQFPISEKASLILEKDSYKVGRGQKKSSLTYLLFFVLTKWKFCGKIEV